MGSKKADLKPVRADLGSRRVDLRTKRGLSSFRGTDVRTYRWTDRLTFGNSPLCPTGHRPFGAAAQKAQ